MRTKDKLTFFSLGALHGNLMNGNVFIQRRTISLILMVAINFECFSTANRHQSGLDNELSGGMPFQVANWVCFCYHKSTPIWISRGETLKYLSIQVLEASDSTRVSPVIRSGHTDSIQIFLLLPMIREEIIAREEKGLLTIR